VRLAAFAAIGRFAAVFLEPPERCVARDARLGAVLFAARVLAAERLCERLRDWLRACPLPLDFFARDPAVARACARLPDWFFALAFFVVVLRFDFFGGISAVYTGAHR
jgi:hypothetical protein